MVQATASYHEPSDLLPSHDRRSVTLRSLRHQHQFLLSLLRLGTSPLHTMRLKRSRSGHRLSDTFTFIPDFSRPFLTMPSISWRHGSWSTRRRRPKAFTFSSMRQTL